MLPREPLTTSRSQPKSSQQNSAAPSTASPPPSASLVPFWCKSSSSTSRPLETTPIRPISNICWPPMRVVWPWERCARTSSCPRSRGDLLWRTQDEDVSAAHPRRHFMQTCPYRSYRRSRRGGDENPRRPMVKSFMLFRLDHDARPV